MPLILMQRPLIYIFILIAIFSCNETSERGCQKFSNRSFQKFEARQEFDGDKIIREFFVDANCLLNGFDLKYYENGYIREVAQYYDDLVIGPKYEFNPDGTIISIEYFENGLLEGISRYYHPNGRMSRLCHYSKGNLVRCDDVRYTIG